MGFAFHSLDWLQGAEQSSVDQRFSLRGEQSAPADVVIVGIDDKTLAAAGGQYPLDRRQHARVVRALAAAGAGVIAYDVSFSGTSDSEESDASLIEAVHDTPRVVLGTLDVGADGSSEIFGDPEALAYSGATVAGTRMVADSDGVVRKLDIKANAIDSLAVAAARLKLGRTAHFPPEGREWIDYPGGAGTFTRLSFADVESRNVPRGRRAGQGRRDRRDGGQARRRASTPRWTRRCPIRRCRQRRSARPSPTSRCTTRRGGSTCWRSCCSRRLRRWPPAACARCSPC